MGLMDNGTGSQNTDENNTDNGANYVDAPSYQVGADAHNYGNGNFAITDPTTWGQAPANVVKFTVASAMSGLTSIANSALTVSNWLGNDANMVDTKETLSNLDDNLGEYYDQHKQGTDTVGFIVSSLLPGMGGIKVFNAGQKILGAVADVGMGANMARAVGLLPDAAEKFAQAAASDIASSGAQISLMNQNVIKSLSAGVVQNVLEGAAFTTAVQATMFKSPVLEGQDGWDIAQNILTGGILQGAIGGVFSAAKMLGIVKRGVTAADEALMPSNFITELPAKATAADRAVQNLQDIASTTSFKDVDEFSQYLNATQPNASELDAQSLFNRYNLNLQNRSTRLNNLLTQNIRELTGGDQEMTEMLTHTLSTIDPIEAQGNLEQLLEVGRLRAPLKTEQQILARAAGKGLIEEGAEEGPLAAGNKEVNYVKLFGDDAGNQINVHPLPEQQALADRVDDVGATVRRFGFGNNWSLAKSADDLNQIESRYIWAKDAQMQAGMKINEDDIPLMEQAYLRKLPVNVTHMDGSVQSITAPNDMFQLLAHVKDTQAQALLDAGKNTDYIAKATNVSRDYLEHSRAIDPTNDLLARQFISSQYTKQLIDRGLWSSSKGEYPLDTKPSWAKIAYSTKAYKDADGNVVKGMARIAAIQKSLQTGYENVFAKGVGDEDLAARFIPVPKQAILKANRYGSGPGFFKFANGSYGSLSSLAENIGKATSDLQRILKERASFDLDGPLYKLATKPQAAIEFSQINAEIAATTEKYVLEQGNGSPYLISRNWKRYQEAIAAGKQVEAPIIQQGARIQIPITNAETSDAIAAHIKTNGSRLSTFKEIRASQGLEDSKDAETFYPLKPDPSEYKHFAFVVDPTVTGAGHIKMIHATNADDLGQLVSKVPDPYRVITKAQSEEFHKTIDDYQWDRTLHENYIDSEIQSKGINSQFFPMTDPEKIVQQIKDFHLRGQDVLARELVNMKYQTEFSELRRLSEQFNIQNASKYGSSFRYAEDATKNPYLDYIKTSLNLSRVSEHPLWQGLNDKLDRSVSTAWNTIGSIFDRARTPDDLDVVNSALQSYGLKTAYQDAATQLLANKSPNVGVLRQFISRSNALLANLTLRLDPLNSINYAIGHQVLNGSEFTSILRAIRSGNANVAGDLAKLTNVKLPQVEDFIRSPGRLISNSIKNFLDDSKDGKVLSDFYRQNGWIKDVPQQFHSLLDDLTINGSENPSILTQRLSSAFSKAKELNEKAATLSGSKLSEQFQGFIAADVMRQITDIGQNAGVLSADESRAYINTFVNRVRGNLLASQRPLMFQGPIGQAIGLFQTYQFNLAQQLLRHVAEGSSKDVATMLGLQGTLYGMSSLPAFNYINQHIVGMASGNPMHRDLYDATYGAAGKEAGDFLMYGGLSNLLRVNLYARGHMNPRNISVVPTSLSDVPIVQSWGKFFGSLKDTVTQIAQGGNVWQSMLTGVEHNGLNRPLAGLAQVLQSLDTGGYAYATTSKGNILGANDLFSIASLTRLSGGRPLDEALVNDRVNVIKAYQAADIAKMEQLGESMKSTLRAGDHPSPEQVDGFAARYAALGGKQGNFSNFMMKQMLQANTSQANRLAGNLSGKFSQSMQTIMGGGYSLDGTRIDPVSGLSYGSEDAGLGNLSRSTQ